MAKKRRTKKQKAFTKKVITFCIALGLIGLGRLSADSDFSLDALASALTTTTSATETTSTEMTTTSVTEDLLITYLDVGQADCTLIQANGGNMLIDGGNNEDGETIVAYLQTQGVETLDYVIATHPHADHVGGLDNVINAVDVEHVIMPNAVSTSQTFEDMVDAISENEVDVIAPVVGNSYTLGDCNFTILGPVWDYGNELNDWSVAIQLVHGENSFIFTGDAEEEAEEDMLGTNLNLQGDVFQAGHHGSSTSNTDAFLDAVNPQYVVISCGEGNSYGHPHDEILTKFSQRDIVVYRTDINGNIIATSNGVDITWETEK